MTAASSIAWAGPLIAPSIWLTSATAPRRSSADRARKSRSSPFAPRMRISSGAMEGWASPAAAATAVSPVSPIAMMAAQPHRCHAGCTPRDYEPPPFPPPDWGNQFCCWGFGVGFGAGPGAGAGAGGGGGGGDQREQGTPSTRGAAWLRLDGLEVQ